MSYKLEFLKDAKKEWDKLGETIKYQFKKKLKERLVDPEVESSRLSGSQHRYKIKLKAAGYRLVYEVEKERIVVVVVAVGKRERNQVYKIAAKRI